MGLFKKRKTSVEKKNLAITQSKIVKLSYLQTLAISGGLTSIDGLDLETEAKDKVTLDNNNTKTGNDITKTNDLVNNTIKDNPVLGFIPGALNIPIFSNIVNALFGKKVSVSTQTTASDTGWNIIKTWNQPQFDVIRYALGIKELEVSQFTYEQVSEIVSIPWSSPKEIVKISLYVDQFIPNEFPAGDSYIKYYIKVDDQSTEWTRINPIGLPTVFNEDGTIVPRIISFNIEKPINSRLEESYIYIDKPVKTVRFRAVLSRPDTITNNPEVSADAYTPILKSYKLIMIPKGGL